MKLSKDFTNESMMVESLLSFLVDEDLRLEEEEKKKKISEHGESSNTQTENFLEIKDDHFGDCTTATFLDYFSPLSKTIDDQGLISLKNRIYEEKSKERETSVTKINQDLCKLLSKSDISEKLPLMETSLKMPENKDCQYVADILLFSSHGDPVLRSNVYAVIGNFIKCIHEKNLDYKKAISKHEFVKDILNFEALIKLLLDGLNDEIHSVVKQTLISWEKCINLLIPVMSNEQAIKAMNGILMVSNNKYWLVQMKYCDVIVRIDLDRLENKNHAEVYRVS
jgi:huntingtin